MSWFIWGINSRMTVISLSALWRYYSTASWIDCCWWEFCLIFISLVFLAISLVVFKIFLFIHIFQLYFSVSRFDTSFCFSTLITQRVFSVWTLVCFFQFWTIFQSSGLQILHLCHCPNFLRMVHLLTLVSPLYFPYSSTAPSYLFLPFSLFTYADFWVHL